MATVAARIKLRQLEEQAEASWERPPGRHVINGQILLTSDRHLIPYGGGRWWVAAEWLWYIRNNGAADDAWDLNNIRTVGAGAIGWRQPRNVTFEAMLRAIAATVGD
jgi:hypothetical protein